jgi:hypothetical protein
MKTDVNMMAYTADKNQGGWNISDLKWMGWDD